MPVGYRSSSTSGAGDTFAASRTCPVPSGAAAGDVVLFALEQWESANPATTVSGFTALASVVNGSGQKLKIFGKELTGSDAGNYTASWTGSQWCQAQCICITGATLTGFQFDTDQGSGTTITATSLTTTGAPFLASFVANESSSTKTAPTGYTEVQDANYLESAYLLGGAGGSQSATGATQSVSTAWVTVLIGLEPSGGGAPALPPILVMPTRR